MKNRVSEKELHKKITKYPYDVTARLKLAHFLRGQNRLLDAEEVFRETLMLFPKSDEAWNGLAEVLQANKRIDEAEALYREAINRFPDNLICKNGLATLLKEEDRFAFASTEGLFYESQQLPDSEISGIIIETQAKLIEKISTQPTILYSLPSRVFEEVIAEIFNGFGYEVELTACTRDGGRDIIAIKNNDLVSTKLLVECKRFKKNRKVGVNYVRQLYAVKAIERASKCVMATTSSYTRDARKIEEHLFYELELKDYDAVVSWADEYHKTHR